MAAEKSPAFQFYPKDFMADAHVVAMTLPERGAYITLLCLCWMEGSLPVDMAALARRCKVSRGTFTRLWPALEPCFTFVDGRLVQPRIERERRKQIAWRAMKSAAGKQGGRPKAEGKQKQSRTKANESPPSPSSTNVLKNPLTPFQGARITRADRKLAETIRRQRFGQCFHYDDPCVDGLACETRIAKELAARRAS